MHGLDTQRTIGRVGVLDGDIVCLVRLEIRASDSLAAASAEVRVAWCPGVPVVHDKLAVQEHSTEAGTRQAEPVFATGLRRVVA